MKRVHGVFVLPLTVWFGLSIAGCSSDDSSTNGGGNGAAVTVPASWGGTWQITSTPTTTLGTGAEVDIQPLCAGMSVEDLFGEFDEFIGLGSANCTGTWTDTDANVQCTTVISYKGCTINVSMTLDMTRSGDTMMGTQSVSFTSEPSGCAGPDEVLSWDVMGTRLDGEQFGCGADLDHFAPSGWGGFWTLSEVPAGRSGGGTLVCPDQTSATELFYPFVFNASTTGGFREGSAEVFGSYAEPEASCLSLITDKITVTRNGDTLTGTRERTVRTVADPNQGGKCSGVSLMSWDISGTRISTDTSPCSLGEAFPRPEFDPDDFRLF